MQHQFTAVYKKQGKWFLGWVEEIPGVNTQGKTRREVKESLREALALILETNRTLTREAVGSEQAIREPVSVSLA